MFLDVLPGPISGAEALAAGVEVAPAAAIRCESACALGLSPCQLLSLKGVLSRLL